MARRVRKVCPSCQQLFVGRRDAKTCSERCRKRLQRARLLVQNSAAGGFGAPGGGPVGTFDSRYVGKAMATRRSKPEGGRL